MTNYEQEQAERAELDAQAEKLGAAIAKALGGTPVDRLSANHEHQAGETFVAFPSDFGSRPTLEIERVERYRTKSRRLQISWRKWPEGADGRLIIAKDVAQYIDNKREEPPSTSITVSMDKTPEQIARDVKRRIIDVMEPWYARCMARAIDERERKGRVAELVERFGNRLNAGKDWRKVADSGCSGRVGAQGRWPFYSLDISESRIEFDHLSLSPDTAMRLLEWLSLNAPKQEQE